MISTLILTKSCKETSQGWLAHTFDSKGISNDINSFKEILGGCQPNCRWCCHGVVISGDDAFRTLIDFGTSTNEVLGTAEEEEEEEAAIDEAMSIFY